MVCKTCEEDVDLKSHSVDQCRELRWRKMTPPLYRHSDSSRFPQKQFAEAMAWTYGQRGLLLTGVSGQSKTRIAYHVLRREHMAGRRVVAFDCVSFGHLCGQKFLNGQGEDWIESIARKDIVFFDDIDKPRFTDRVETELFGLIEKRIANCLPIFATTQTKGEEFAAMFANQHRGSAIVRRLREFCDVIKF